jgi:hypothetical protein
VARGIPAHPPSHRLATRAWTGGDVLASHGSACGYYPSLSSIKIADQDVEMHAGRERIAIPGSLERKPLTMRRRFQRDPARVPLHRRPAEQSGPEGCQPPRIRSIQHNLAYPPDHRIVVTAHEPIITSFTGPLAWTWLSVFATLGRTLRPRISFIGRCCLAGSRPVQGRGMSSPHEAMRSEGPG